MKMVVELYISGELIESIVVKADDCRTYEYRKEKVDGVVNWLKYKYRSTMIIKDTWQFVLTVQSKLNDVGFMDQVPAIDERMVIESRI